MITLTERFATLRARGEKALVLFFTAGDQPIEQLPAIVAALEEGGADAVEIGIPFSDPFGEGPTIQASSQRALENGVTPAAILDAIAITARTIPVVVMGYLNPVLRFGYEAFATRSREVGVTGAILSDLVPEEADDWIRVSAEHGLETIFLVAPTSTEKRIEEVSLNSTGFVYVVSRTGVTGAESTVPPDVAALVARVRALTDKPACVGFGVSTPEHVRMVCSVADGAVVGSALVKLLHEEWNDGAGREKIVQFVRSLKQAT